MEAAVRWWEINSFPKKDVEVKRFIYTRIRRRSKLAVSELEINIKFPTCWDGQNVESATGDHVMYAPECNGDEHNECFDFDCPASHPVRMPEIALYVRVLGYEVSCLYLKHQVFRSNSRPFKSKCQAEYDFSLLICRSSHYIF